jgi:hypothetical protein
MTGSRRALIIVAVLFAAMFGLPGVGAVPEAAAQISVTAADPPTGEQGALNLSVIIKGKGFKNGAKAKFFKTGTTDPAGVNVKSTQFVSSSQLIASIDISDGAALSLFDIQVANTDGRTGKGTELFTVVQKGNLKPEYEAEFVEFKPDDPTWTPKIRGDGLGPYSPVTMGEGYGFHLSTLVSNGRSITFQFNDPDRPFASTVPCIQWGSHAPYTQQTPAYLLSSDRAVVPDQADLFTSNELVWNEALGRWDPVVETSRRNQTLYKKVYPWGMLPGQKVYGMLVIAFRLDLSSNDTYEVDFNNTFFGELMSSFGRGGIVEIERPGEEEVWYIRPISDRFPVLGDPPAAIPQNYANHAWYDTRELKDDVGGNCDFGYFAMRFELRISRK